MNPFVPDFFFAPILVILRYFQEVLAHVTSCHFIQDWPISHRLHGEITYPGFDIAGSTVLH